MENEVKAIRHGDCLIMKIDSIPTTGVSKKSNNNLLEGETTGHAHRLNGGNIMVCDEEPTAQNNYRVGYFELDKETNLTHEEHSTITLEPGIYTWFSQREYDAVEEHRVLD